MSLAIVKHRQYYRIQGRICKKNHNKLNDTKRWKIKNLNTMGTKNCFRNAEINGEWMSRIITKSM